MKDFKINYLKALNMSRNFQKPLALLAILSATAACNSGQSGPISPSAVHSPSASYRGFAGTDGQFSAVGDVGLPAADVTLKVSAPTRISPQEGAVINDISGLTLTVANPQGTFINDPITMNLEFEIWQASPLNMKHTGTASSGASNSSFTVPANILEDGTIYVWRARGVIDGAVGPWSGQYSFETQLVSIGIPELSSPSNGSTVVSLRPTFTLINPEITPDDVECVLVQVQFSTDSTFATKRTAITEVRIAQGQTNLPSSGALLEAETTYYWRARATNDDLTNTAALPETFEYVGAGRKCTPDTEVTKIYSDWTETWSFTTPSEEEAEEPSSGGGGGSGGGSSGNPGSSPDAPFTTNGGNPANLISVIQQVAIDNPGTLQNSCQEGSGNWTFMDLSVEALRNIDGRWGYNCKRGNCNDISHDVVDYYRGSGTTRDDAQNSTSVTIIDIILGHCGANPQVAWIDQTEETANAGTVGRWKYPR
tara:strand:- start:21432 stop:22874 length:1443 start_codon:yes stop_codon:yes gene_type:complete